MCVFSLCALFLSFSRHLFLHVCMFLSLYVCISLSICVFLFNCMRRYLCLEYFSVCSTVAECHFVCVPCVFMPVDIFYFVLLWVIVRLSIQMRICVYFLSDFLSAYVFVCVCLFKCMRICVCKSEVCALKSSINSIAKHISVEFYWSNCNCT